MEHDFSYDELADVRPERIAMTECWYCDQTIAKDDALPILEHFSDGSRWKSACEACYADEMNARAEELLRERRAA